MGRDDRQHELARLREDFAREPRAGALRLAQRLSWHSMELALAKDYATSDATWTEALDVARGVLAGPGPSQFELTELIRIAVGASRSMVLAGRGSDAMPALDEAEQHYQDLAAQASDPTTVLALRGAILTARAEVFADAGEADAARDAWCEAALELMAGSGTNPLIVKSMLREPLRELGRLLAQA